MRERCSCDSGFDFDCSGSAALGGSGGSGAELHADDPAATDIRPTMDVDCVIELAAYGSLHDFEQIIRERKFDTFDVDRL